MKEKNLPEPLLEYLFENRGSLVIKGDAGTGKTRMAIEIMIEAMSRGILLFS
ncbi:MAG: hypothetical protein J7L07_09050 [Candidatus Odinarchaeota archaeon]|nr:hypothetical protein [Candidatus Odinarchaeota archaeon]